MRHETKRQFDRVGNPSSTGHAVAAARWGFSLRRSAGGGIFEFGSPMVAGLSTGREAGTTFQTCARPAAAVACATEKGSGTVVVARATGGRIYHRRLDVEPCKQIDPPAFRRSVSSGTCLEVVAKPVGVELPEAGATSQRTGRGVDRSLETLQVASYKKRRANLVPIWPFWMKVGSCLSRMSAKHGRREDKRRGFGTAIDTTAFRPYRPSPFRRLVTASDFLFIFISPTSVPRKSWSSYGHCFDMSVAPSSCSGMGGPSTGTLPSKHSSARIPVCRRNGFPRMLQNSIPMSSFGPRRNMNWPTAQPRILATLAGAWATASDEYGRPSLSWLHLSLLPSCRGPNCIHSLCEAQ